jgi:hypothetical protein
VLSFGIPADRDEDVETVPDSEAEVEAPLPMRPQAGASELIR